MDCGNLVQTHSRIVLRVLRVIRLLPAYLSWQILCRNDGRGSCECGVINAGTFNPRCKRGLVGDGNE